MRGSGGRAVVKNACDPLRAAAAADIISARGAPGPSAEAAASAAAAAAGSYKLLYVYKCQRRSMEKR